MGSQPEGAGLDLLPWPRTLDFGSGSIELAGRPIEAAFDGVRTERLERAVSRLAEEIRWRAGPPDSDADPLTLRIRCEASSAPVPGIHEDESYWLVVDDAGVYLDAAGEWGALRGLVTFGQLLRDDGSLPHAAIDDAPRYPWRGLLLDPARRFLPLDALLRTLDGMAACKLNVLHLHLSDDQGFRFPVPAYPRLASDPAYSEEELARLVAHAADRGIRVVPEIDMPGHVTSWLTAYPEWGSRQVAPTDRFGVHPGCLDPANEAVFDAVAEILAALAKVFPDPCLHIGGDEVSPGWWSEDPAVRALMDREALPDVAAVQAYFNGRVGARVEELGRVVVGWDEVLNGALPQSWIVQAWRGATARDRVLAQGNRVVVSAPYYLDLNYPVDVHCRCDPAAPQAELLALEDELQSDPRFAHVAAGMAWTNQWREGAVDGVAHDALVLGAEACLWGELVDEAVLDVRLWSRLPALADLFWTGLRHEEPTDLLRRLDGYLDKLHPLRGLDLEASTRARLEALGIHPDWLELTAMLEPVKWYGRLLGSEALAARLEGREMPQARPYGVSSKLTGLADWLPPESRRARSIADLCGREASGDADAARQLREVARRWQELGRRAADAPLALEPLAERLGRLASLLEQRLASESALDDALLIEIGEPLDELMIALPPGLRAWLAAS